MTAFDRSAQTPRFEQELRAALRDHSGSARPDYLNDVLLRTVETRQRPAWTFPGRWLPMSSTTTRLVATARIPLRILVVAALLIALIAAALLLVAGSQRRGLSPFGLARNGLIAFSANGDIETVDPASGRTTVVVPGAATDVDPVFSRDGAQLVFQRQDASGVRLVVAAADGSGVHVVTSTAASTISDYSFSPDGTQIAYAATGADGTSKVWIAQAEADGQGARMLSTPTGAEQPLWLPSGRIVYVSVVPNGAPDGLYQVDPATGQIQTVIAPRPLVSVDVPAVSPDGQQIAYSAANPSDTTRNTYQVHVANLDGSGDRVIPIPAGATFQDLPVWSNDGLRLALIRGYSTRNQDVRVAIVPVLGASGVETRSITGCCDNLLAWAPDDTSVLLLPEDSSGTFQPQLSIDPATGKVTAASWGAISPPAWQRRAP